MHRLEVVVRVAKPPIWRRLGVSSVFTLRDLSVALQICLGWDDAAYVYTWKGVAIGPPRCPRARAAR